MNVLVTYATKHGATAEIAEKVGEVLRQSGLTTEVLPVKEVQDLSPYTAVVLGIAVYVGQWRKEAIRFLEEHEQELAERDTWIFSSGPTGEGDPVELMQGWEMPKGQRPLVERIQPHDFTVFHGSLDLDTLGFVEKTVIKNVKAPVGDFRDWEMITKWATAVADTLKQPA